MRLARIVFVLACTAAAGSTLLAAPAGAGGGCASPSIPITQARVGAAYGMAIADCTFEVDVLYVDKGAEVTWTNKDLFDHTVTGAHSQWGSSEALAQGDTISERFDDEGVFAYYCLFHPGMGGVVVVGDPNPDDVEAELSTSGIGIPADTTGSGAAGAARVRSEADSDALSTVQLLGLIALLVVAGAIVTAAVVRRSGRLSPEA